MRVRVLFFGATAAAVGTHETSIDLSPDSDVSVVEDLIVREYTALKSHKLLFSVNQEYAASDTRVNDGDELAIFTPVSGG